MSSLINKDTIDDIYDAIDEINVLMFDEKTYPYAPVLNIKNALPIPAVDCKVKVKPIQDLHGYDHPWVGGAGKNKCDWNVSPTSDALSIALSPNTYTISAKSTLSAGNWYFRFTDVNDNYISSPSAVGLNGYTFAESGWIYGGLNSQTVTFTIPSDCKLLEVGKLNADGTIPAQIEVGSTATTFTPYSNICPISGINELEIPVSRKNILPKMVVGSTTKSGITYTVNSDGSANVNGTSSGYSDISLDVTDALKNFGGQTAFFSGNPSSNNNTNIRQAMLINGSAYFDYNEGVEITLPDKIETAIYLVAVAGTGTVASNVLFKPQLELGSTPTEYEPYVSHTTTIPLPSTLYGGEENVTNGSGNSRYGMVTENYIANIRGVSSGGLYWCDIDAGAIDSSESKSSMLPKKDGDSAWRSSEDCYTIANDTNKIRLYFKSSTEADAKLELAGLQIAYELATPTTISFAPADVELLEGTNVVSTNGESIELTVGGLVDNIDYLGSDQIITGKKTINNDLYVNGDIYIWGTKFNNKYMFGFHIDSSESDGDATVTYLNDARGITPAYMDYTTGKFNYGGWGDAFFMPKPCMLKYNGTVDYYLDPNDFSKTINGASSDISDFSYDGNAMIEWGRDNNLIWVSVIPDSNSEDDSSYTVRIANYEADSTFHPWSHYAYNNKIVPHFYTPIYNGTIDGSGRLRSISGKDYTAYCKNKSRAEEIAAAMANDPDANTKIWYTEILTDNKLIEYLLILISKSLASQIKFGEGRTGYQWAESNLATTGLMDAKGMFYGENTTTGLGVKVFGREHRWGNQWQAEAGLINDNGTIKVKLTRGIADGSSTSDYNTDATGYLTVANIIPTGTSGSYIKKAKADSMGIVLPFDASGTASTYYGDGLWFNNGQLNYALRGGYCDNGSLCGAFSSDLDSGPGARHWGIGAGLSCKPFL